MDDSKLAEMGLNTEILHDLLSSGAPKKEVARELGMSVASLNRTIKELQTGQGLLLQYRELQHLQLTNLQAKVLEAMTPEKIEAASLTELAQVYRVLKDKELVVQGKANNITGLVGYLVELERREMAGENFDDLEVPIEAEVVSTEECDEEEELPRL